MVAFREVTGVVVAGGVRVGGIGAGVVTTAVLPDVDSGRGLVAVGFSVVVAIGLSVVARGVGLDVALSTVVVVGLSNSKESSSESKLHCRSLFNLNLIT